MRAAAAATRRRGRAARARLRAPLDVSPKRMMQSRRRSGGRSWRQLRWGCAEGWAAASVCVCVCVCVREGEREGMCMQEGPAGMLTLLGA